VSAYPPPLDAPERALVIGAHPDDAEFYAGAAIASLCARGTQLTIVVCTDGARGGAAGMTDLPARRRSEAGRAAAALGDVALVFLGFRDGELAPDDELRRKLVREIRRARPELVLAHDPTTHFLRVGASEQFVHSDHRAAGQATLDAIYPRTGLATFYPDQIAAGLAPWVVREAWLMESGAPDHFVPVGPHAATKRAALEAHASQDPAGLLRASAEREAHWAGAAGAPAEGFRRLRVY